MTMESCSKKRIGSRTVLNICLYLFRTVLNGKCAVRGGGVSKVRLTNPTFGTENDALRTYRVAAKNRQPYEAYGRAAPYP